MNTIDWFRTKFIPNCSEDTIAALMFLYRKYCEQLSDDEKQFIREQKEIFKNTEAQE